jgi:hypothetical protein
LHVLGHFAVIAFRGVVVWRAQTLQRQV